MRIDEEQLNPPGARTRSRPPAMGFLGKVLAVAAGVIVLVAALVFSLLLVAVVASVGVIAWAYLWWRTRDLRKQMREQSRERPNPVTIIEGEFSRAPKSHDDAER